MGLKTLIIDDDPAARKLLRDTLVQLDEIEIAGEVSNSAAAAVAMRKHSPELVFLDLDVMKKLPPAERNASMLVIVTADDQHAVQAFEAGAIDYLLKPVNKKRLAQTVERAMRFRDRSEVGTSRRIVARSGDEYLMLNSAEVYAFQAEGDLVWIMTAKKRYLATQSLKTIQEKLQKTSFRRVHRRALVNIDHVRKMSALSSQRWLLTLSNNQEFIVSKRQARNVRESF